LRYFYNLALFLYKIALNVAVAFNTKARLMLQGRKEQKAIWSTLNLDNYQKVVWMHCASLGEFEQGRSVLENIKANYPKACIILTFFSSSGYEIRKNTPLAHYVFYLPLDSANNAQKFIEAIKPNVAIFVKYEFWYYYCKNLKDNSIPLLLISGIFRENQIFFKPWGAFFRNILKNFDQLFLQDSKSVSLLHFLNNDKLQLAGDTRFDRVFMQAQSVIDLPVIEAFCATDKVLVVGSAWAEDLALIIPVLNNAKGAIKAIIAPHEIEEKTLRLWEEQLEIPSVRYSQYETKYKEGNINKVLFVDNIGMLSKIYYYAHVVYLGGAFGKGLHNTLEAATFGKPVLFGNKNYAKFNEALGLIETHAAHAIGTISELENLINNYWYNTDFHKEASINAANFVQNNTGATELIMNYLEQKKYLL
jgi:3-deoxy-D-manno-octulosonic-acid transferase